MAVMEDMLKDFLLGEHLLLVGNQVSGGRDSGPGERPGPFLLCVGIRPSRWFFPPRPHAHLDD